MREKGILPAAENESRESYSRIVEIPVDDGKKRDSGDEAREGRRTALAQRLPSPIEQTLLIKVEEVPQTKEPTIPMAGSSTSDNANTAESKAARRFGKLEKRAQVLAPAESDSLTLVANPSLDSADSATRQRRKEEKRAKKAAKLSAHASVEGSKKKKRKRGDQAEVKRAQTRITRVIDSERAA